jgi:predicted phage tail component-like protein
MYGFTFNSIDSSDYGVYMLSKNRALLPSMRKREIVIPGRHGTYDFSDNTYDNRLIEVEINYLGSDFNDMRLTARDIAAWLSQQDYCKLQFDDESDKYYLAKIYDAIGLENIQINGKATLVFECQPHALSIVTTAEDIYLDSDVALDMDLILDSGDDYIISL